MIDNSDLTDMQRDFLGLVEQYGFMFGYPMHVSGEEVQNLVDRQLLRADGESPYVKYTLTAAGKACISAAPSPLGDPQQSLDADQYIIEAFFHERIGVLLIASGGRRWWRIASDGDAAYLQTLSAWLRANAAADANPFSLN